MTRNIAIPLPAEANAPAAGIDRDKATKIASATGSVVKSCARTLCEALAAYAGASTAAHVAPFEVLSSLAKRERKDIDR
jgi:hypothetical protein